MNKEEQEHIIILEDKTILPIHMYTDDFRGFVRVSEIDGSTKVVKFLGFESLEETTGKYYVFASAAKYFCEIAHLSNSMYKDSDAMPSQPIKKEILFAGSILIYEKAHVFGQDMFQLVDNGKIFLSRPNEKKYKHFSLPLVIFDSEIKPEKSIDAILAGFRSKEAERRSAQLDREHQSYISGRNYDFSP